MTYPGTAPTIPAWAFARWIWRRSVQACRRCDRVRPRPDCRWRTVSACSSISNNKGRESLSMHPLPQQVDTARYWQELYRQPLPFWQPALDQIMAVHQLVASPWTRAALGRNIVFVSPTAVIKLGPPMWQGEMQREAAALSTVAGRLPVTTPTLLACGELDGWDYLVQAPLPGTNLHAIWAGLD